MGKNVAGIRARLESGSSPLNDKPGKSELALSAAGGLGGGKGALRDWLRIASHGVEDEGDGGVAEHDADSDRGGDGDEKRECDDQRIQARPPFLGCGLQQPLDGPPKKPPFNSPTRAGKRLFRCHDSSNSHPDKPGKFP